MLSLEVVNRLLILSFHITMMIFQKKKHNDDIHEEHNYNHKEYASQYMPARFANTFVMRLQDRHRLEDIFPGIVRIFNFYIFFYLLYIKCIIYSYTYILNCYAWWDHDLLLYTWVNETTWAGSTIYVTNMFFIC